MKPPFFQAKRKRKKRSTYSHSHTGKSADPLIHCKESLHWCPFLVLPVVFSSLQKVEGKGCRGRGRGKEKKRAKVHDDCSAADGGGVNGEM